MTILAPFRGHFTLLWVPTNGVLLGVFRVLEWRESAHLQAWFTVPFPLYSVLGKTLSILDHHLNRCIQVRPFRP